MGSATAYQLARKGNRVLGIDRFSPPHVHRVDARRHPDHAPRDRRGRAIHAARDALARDLARTRTRDGRDAADDQRRPRHCRVAPGRRKATRDHFFANTVAAAEKYGIPHEIWTPRQIRRRFPQFNVARRRIGLLRAQRRISCGRRNASPCSCASRNGRARHCTGTRPCPAFPLRMAASPSRPERDTYFGRSADRHRGPVASGSGRGSIHPASHHLSAGALLVRHRRTGHAVPSGEFPGVHLGTARETAGDLRLSGHRWRARRPQGRDASNTTSRRLPTRWIARCPNAEIRALYDDYVAPYISGLSGRCVKAASCLYTVTPDFGFVIDTLPGARAGNRRVALLRSRLQALGRNRRGAGRVGDRRRAAPRPLTRSR